MDIDGAIARAAQLVVGEMYEEAMREYSTAFKSASNDERVHCGMALSLIMMDKQTDAMTILGLAAVNHLDAGWPHGVIGTIMQEKNHFDQAVESYDEMIKLDPSDAPAYVRKSQILLDRGLDKECASTMAECAKVAGLYREPPRAVERLREMFKDVNAGRLPKFEANDEAAFMPGLRDLLDRAMGKEVPWKTPTPYTVRLSGSKERARAIEVVDEMLRFRPDSAEIWSDKGSLLYEGGRADEALACCERAIKMAPGMMVARAEKLVILQDAGDRAGMMECLRAAIAAEPDDAINAEMQGGLRTWLKIVGQDGAPRFRSVHNADAIRRHIARRLVPDKGLYRPSTRQPSPQARPPPLGMPDGRMFPPGLLDGAGDARGRGADAERRSGKRRPAGRSRSLGRASPPSDRLPGRAEYGRRPAEDAFTRAAWMLADEKFDEAMFEYETVRGAPREERALCGKALVHMCRGQLDEALKCAYRVLGLRPDASYPYGIAGMIMEDSERFFEALASYERMLSMDPGEVPAYVRKAQLFRLIERENECQQAIKECLAARRSGRESPKEKRRLREMGDAVAAGLPARLEAGDNGTFFPGLWEMLEVALGPDPGWAVSVPDCEPDFEGARLAGRGDMKKYIALVDQYIERHPSRGEQWCMKGTLLIQDGRPDEASACYDRSMEVDPGETLAYSCNADLLFNAGYMNGALECLRVGITVEPKDQSCASLQENLREMFKEVEGGGPWPNVSSFSVIPDMIMWAARRRSKPREFVDWPVMRDRNPVLPSRSGKARKSYRTPIRTG